MHSTAARTTRRGATWAGLVALITSLLVAVGGGTAHADGSASCPAQGGILVAVTVDYSTVRNSNGDLTPVVHSLSYEIDGGRGNADYEIWIGGENGNASYNGTYQNGKPNPGTVNFIPDVQGPAYKWGPRVGFTGSVDGDGLANCTARVFMHS